MEDLEVIMAVNANRHGRDLESMAKRLAAISAKRNKRMVTGKLYLLMMFVPNFKVGKI